MANPPTEADIARALFLTDPMNTGCVENDLYDEYDAIADAIAIELASGWPLKEAIRRGLVDSFGEELIDEGRIAPVVEHLETH